MKQETIFLSVAANHFSEMRLMAEGAIALYENQATVLCRMARDADNHEAQIAFNDIGAALYVAHQMNVSELARICGLSRPTVYKYLKMVG